MKATPAIRVMVVDDHALVRVGMVTVVNQQPDMQIVAETGSGQQALELCRQTGPDIVLMDMRLNGDNGARVTRQLLGEMPAVRVLMISNYEGDADIRQALEAGAKGYLFKSIVEEELVDAIREIHRGRSYIPRCVAGRLEEHESKASLTQREQELLQLLSKGLNNREIGQILGIAEDTVKTHLKTVFRKLEVANRAEAVRAALQRGFLRD